MDTLCVYQSYGNEIGHIQTLYAILTALAFASKDKIQIHLYTDNISAFNLVQNEVKFHYLSPETIQKWRGEHDFTHRLKIMMLLDLHQQFPQTPILYLDGDTFLHRIILHFLINYLITRYLCISGNILFKRILQVR